jgi:hypothetical protein
MAHNHADPDPKTTNTIKLEWATDRTKTSAWKTTTIIAKPTAVATNPGPRPPNVAETIAATMKKKRGAFPWKKGSMAAVRPAAPSANNTAAA